MKVFFKKFAAAVLMMCLVVSMVFAVSPKAEASGKLITQYKFNGDFKDASGNGNDGAKVGDVSFADDSTVGKCAVFNGGYIEVKSSPGLNLGSQFTVSVWVLVDPSMAANGNKNGSIISKLDDAGNYNNYHAYTRGTFGVRVDSRFTSGEGSIQTGPFQDWGLSGNWSHLVFSYDGANLYLYDNGALKATKAISGGASIKSSGNKMRIGTGNDLNNSNLFYMGRMADLRIYNYTLSSDEIKAMYDGGADTTQAQPATTTGTTTPGTTTSGTTTPGTGTTGASTTNNGAPVTIINNTTNNITNATNTTNNANTSTNITGSTISNSNVASNNKTTQTTNVQNAVTVSSYVNVTVNGQPLQSDVKPFVNMDGRTMLPIRAIAEALGAQVGWDAATQTATLTLGAKTVKVTIGQNSILVDGQPVAMDTAAAIKDGRTLLPVRSVGEALGAQVGWDAQTKTVQLNK